MQAPCESGGGKWQGHRRGSRAFVVLCAVCLSLTGLLPVCARSARHRDLGAARADRQLAVSAMGTHLRPRWQVPASVVIALLLAVAAQHALGAGDIRTDGSVGAAQTLAGPKYLIPQTLGRLSGNNLFHSFSVFNVGAGETA